METSSLLDKPGAQLCVDGLGYACVARGGGATLEFADVSFVAEPGDVWYAAERNEKRAGLAAPFGEDDAGMLRRHESS